MSYYRPISKSPGRMECLVASGDMLGFCCCCFWGKSKRDLIYMAAPLPQRAGTSQNLDDQRTRTGRYIHSTSPRPPELRYSLS